MESRKLNPKHPSNLRGRRLRFEPMEDRRVLAVFTVNNLADGPVDSAGDLPGSLRQAVFDANFLPGFDRIVFSPSLSGTILLADGELLVTEAVAFDGRGFETLTIDAQQDSRVLNIASTTGSFLVKGLTLANGMTTGDNGLFDTDQKGGAIRSQSSGTLTLSGTVVRDSRTEGGRAEGGGLFAAGDVVLEFSSVTNNQTAGSYASGGGLATDGRLTIIESSLSGNSTSGRGASGGGAFARGNVDVTDFSLLQDNKTQADRARGGGLFTTSNVSIADSVISGNSTVGNQSAGGGVFALGSVELIRSTIRDNATGIIFDEFNRAVFENQGGGVHASHDIMADSSTISGNRSQGLDASGGGLFAVGDVHLENSTVSGNAVLSPGVVQLPDGAPSYFLADFSSNGGGVSSIGTISAFHSTITDNDVSSLGGFGGGLASYGNITLGHTIVAGNSDNKNASPDIALLGIGQLNADYSLIGRSQGSTLDAGSPGTNLVDVDPLLLPLSSNGGLTEIHVIRHDSPARNAGDPFFFGQPIYDQRGGGYFRIFDGRIDIGAYERELPPPPPPLEIVVDTLSDIDNGDTSPGDYSLREALRAINPTEGSPIFISFDPQLAGGTISLITGELFTENWIDVTGFADNPVSINAGGFSRVLRIDNSEQSVLRGIDNYRRKRRFCRGRTTHDERDSH